MDLFGTNENGGMVKRIVVAGLVVVALGSAVAGCSNSSAAVEGEELTGLTWIDGTENNAVLKTTGSLDLSKDAQALPADVYSVLDPANAPDDARVIAPVGEGYRLFVSNLDSPESNAEQGFIALAGIVRGSQEIVLYDGEGTVDNIDVVVSGNTVTWVELSDSDSAATWDWSIKSMELDGTSPIVLDTATDHNLSDDVPVVIQNFNLTVKDSIAYWSPIYSQDGQWIQGVFSRPVDASAPVSELQSDMKLVAGDSTSLYAQKVTGLAESGAQSAASDFFTVKADAADAVIGNTSGATFEGHAAGELLIALDDQYYLAHPQDQQVLALEGVTVSSQSALACGNTVYFTDRSANESGEINVIALDVTTKKALKFVSSLGTMCATNEFTMTPSGDNEATVFGQWK